MSENDVLLDAMSYPLAGPDGVVGGLPLRLSWLPNAYISRSQLIHYGLTLF